MRKVLLFLLFLSSFVIVEAKIKKDTLLSADTASSNKLVLSLEEAIKIALTENTSIKIADYEVKKQSNVKKQFYAELMPNINSSLSYQRVLKKQIMYLDFNPASFSPSSQKESAPAPRPKNNNGIEIGRFNSFNAAVTATMPLFNAALFEGLKINRESLLLALEKSRESKLNMLEQLKNAYYQVLFAKEASKVFHAEYDNALNNYLLTKQKADKGLSTRLDLLRAKTTVANIFSQLYKADNSVVLALWQLKALIGIDMSTDIDVSGSLDDYRAELDKGVGSDFDNNISFNSQLKQMEIQIRQIESKLKMAKLAYLPSLAANMSMSIGAMSDDFMFREYRWTPYNFIGISLTIPIFSGGKRYYDVKNAQLEKTQMILQKQELERNLDLALHQSLSNMLTSISAYNSALEAVDFAQKALDLAKLSYEQGLSTLTDLDNTQLQLTQAQLSEKQAIYDYIVAKSSMEKILGRDFEN